MAKPSSTQQDRAIELLKERGIARPSELATAGVTAATIARIRSSPQRILGLNRGAITTTDDFDAPLPAEFWLGSE